jgi:hypothetical protein
MNTFSNTASPLLVRLAIAVNISLCYLVLFPSRAQLRHILSFVRQQDPYVNIYWSLLNSSTPSAFLRLTCSIRLRCSGIGKACRC